MIRVAIMDPDFNQAYWNASRTLPVHHLERPRQYFLRWIETFGCRQRGDYVEFDTEQDYMMFMLRWA
jgi:hypothetical protein